MKEIIQHPTYGEIIYTESFWTGKKSLTLNGVQAQKLSKKTFKVGEKVVELKGNLFAGVELLIDEQSIEISPKAKWYEIVFAVLPITFAFTWGNNVTLCSIFPAMGGAIGGVIGAFFSMFSMMSMKKSKKVLHKILIGLAFLVANVVVSNRIAIAFIQALM